MQTGSALNQRFEFRAKDGEVAGSLTQHGKTVCQRRARLLSITAARDAARAAASFYHRFFARSAMSKTHIQAAVFNRRGNGSRGFGESVSSSAITNRRSLSVFNSAHGIGDHVTALYACVGAANAGAEIVFHTRFPQWFDRVKHPGLTITGELPRGGRTTAKGNGSQPKRRNGPLDLNHDPALQLRHAGDKARWYADAIQPGLKPARPSAVE